MNFFEKDKKNSFFLTNLEIESAYKNFSELTSEEITSIKKIKSENFKNSETKNSFELNIIDHRSYHFLIFHKKRAHCLFQACSSKFKF